MTHLFGFEIDPERDIKSTPRQIKDFIGSVVWQDIEHELKVWLEMTRNGLEDIEYFEKPNEVKPISVEMRTRLQGAAATIRRVLQLPEILEEFARTIEDSEEY